jgi:membrane-associated phospholipid phosphatase
VFLCFGGKKWNYLQIIANISDLDITILRFIHHNRVIFFDNVLYYISFTATFVSIGLLLIILLASINAKSKPLRMVFYKMVAVMIIAALMSFTLKSLIVRERPFVTYPDIEKLSEAGNSSFPSGHTLETFAVVVAFSIMLPKRKLFIPLFIWASVVAYSRMALGVHYPSDVMGGMIIGSFIGWLVPWLFNKFYPSEKLKIS